MEPVTEFSCSTSSKSALCISCMKHYRLSFEHQDECQQNLPMIPREDLTLALLAIGVSAYFSTPPVILQLILPLTQSFSSYCSFPH